MKITKFLCAVFLTVLILQDYAAEAQTPQKGCEVKVESKVTNPEPGKKNGKIELTFADTSRKYKVFLINAGEEKARRDQGSVIENLAKGFYDLIITDDKGCSKQITITLN